MGGHSHQKALNANLLCPYVSSTGNHLASITSIQFPPQRTNPPSKDLRVIPSLLVKWLINQHPRVFKRVSNLPCRIMSERRVSCLPSIPSTCNSRVATPSSLSSPFCWAKHNPSVISEKVTESRHRSRRLFQYYTYPLSVATSHADTFGLACQNALMAAFTSRSGFCRHSHLRRQYRLVSLSYLLYVPFSTSNMWISL
jgi:hypothetical protein